MSGEENRIVTLQGLNSNEQIDICLNTIEKLFSWYLQDAPKQYRDLSTVTKVIHMHDQLKDITDSEFSAGIRKIEEHIDGDLSMYRSLDDED